MGENDGVMDGSKVGDSVGNVEGSLEGGFVGCTDGSLVGGSVVTDVVTVELPVVVGVVQIHSGPICVVSSGALNPGGGAAG